MRRRRISAGEIVFREGDASAEAYLVRAGRIEVVKASPRGPVRLAVLGAGDVLGEMGLLDERPRSASARALEEVTLDAISGPEFARLLADDPVSSRAILRVLFERLRAVNTMLTDTVPAAGQDEVAPRVRLVPATEVTRAVLPSDGLELTRFPFRVGRAPAVDAAAAFLHCNDLECPDVEPFVLASNHFAVDLAPEGVVVRDRGSAHGTLVNGVRLGGPSPVECARLVRGDNEVVAGPDRDRPDRRASPFRFHVLVA
jgi:CRP-like cAMP-binding protein